MRTTLSKMASYMETRLKQRALIEFLTAEGCVPIDMHRRMRAVYGDACVDVSTVRRWARTVKGDNPATMTLHDQARSGRPITAVDEQHQARVDELIHVNRRIKQKYVATMKKLRARLLRVRPGKHAVLQHDNARPHTSRQTAATLERLNFDDILAHPPYSPDLAPCDFFLFPKLKEHLKGNRYASDEDVAADVRTWLREKSSDFFFDGMQQLVRRWRVCVERGGDYVEK